MEIENTDKH